MREKIKLKIETVQIKTRERKLKSRVSFKEGNLVKWIDPDAAQEFEHFLIKKLREEK